MKVCIIGIGLIGGSLALDLKKRGFAEKVYGVDNNMQHCHIAKLSGLVDDTVSLDLGIELADLIVLAVPVSAILEILPQILDKIAGTQKIVTDMGSTKKGISDIVDSHPQRKNFVASHPMAGTEFSGPLAAISKMFDYKCTIICDAEKSDPAAVEIVKRMYDLLNMRIIYMESRQHDESAAYVSHISHISSFALSLSVLEKEQNEKRILSLAGGGFESTVRLAKSNSDTWVPIFLQNSKFVLEVLDTYIRHLNQFRKNIEESRAEELAHMINDANKIKKVLS